MKRIFLISLAALFIQGCASTMDPAARHSTPVELEGVPNLHRISDTLYRSGQPTAEGMRRLRALGIRTVVNLRRFHKDHRKAEGTDLKLVPIPFLAWTLSREDVVTFLRTVSRTRDGPFLVHCHNGSDRTGVMVAFYRVVIEGWSKQKAIDEMMRGGYGFNRFWSHLARFVEETDIDALRRELAHTPH